MQIQSSPHLTPSVTIDSPSSPPKSYFEKRSGSRSPERLINALSFGKVQDLISQHSSRSSSRPGTPSNETAEKAVADSNHGPHFIQSTQNPPIQKLPTIPLIASRADKPKIPSKPAPLNAHDLGLVPENRRTSIDKRVSPFNTPPSSEDDSSTERSPVGESVPPSTEGLPARLEVQNDGVLGGQGQAPPRPSANAKDPRLMGFAKPSAPIERKDPRTVGLTLGEHSQMSTTSTRAMGRGTRDAGFPHPKPSQRQVSEDVRPLPPPIAIENAPNLRLPPARDARQLGFGGKQQTVPAVEDRPGLPPRRMGNEPPPRPSEDSKRAAIPSRGHKPSATSVDRSMKAVIANQTALLIVKPDSGTHFLPPPKKYTFSETGPTSHSDPALPVPKTTRQPPMADPIRHPSRPLVAEDSDDAEELIDEPTSSRSEYPDASQTNRRPPFFHQGLIELPIKSDARVFDVCGPYVCTAGYSTRVWDSASGKKIMELNHGETVKVLSVAFKPSQELQNEGSRIWIGNNIGEIHEIDVATYTQIASNNSHNRREIIRILRQKKNLWSLDDEGKLFVWRADETGVPSLKYSHQAYRVQRGHTFSMVVQDKLWLASGREIRVYNPGNEASFAALQKPLSQPGTGEVTSGAYTSQQGGRAYFGHTDGKVTVYSARDYTCLSNVKASDYKINDLAVVGDWLWAAFKTGKIYVYDTSLTPWKVKKDWRAHDGPVAGMLLNPSSIWTLNRLQVISVGYDNCVRLWDGMLEEDWLEATMHDRDVEYCTFREIKATVLTWNVGACNPFDLPSDFVSDALRVESPPELLVFGFQEIVDLEDRAVTAKSFLGFGKKKDSTKTDAHVSRVYREWRDYLAKCIDRCMDYKYAYSELHTSSLIGLFQCVFVRQDERNNIRNLGATDVKCGLKGLYGNKVSIQLSLSWTWLLTVPGCIDYPVRPR